MGSYSGVLAPIFAMPGPGVRPILCYHLPGEEVDLGLDVELGLLVALGLDVELELLVDLGLDVELGLLVDLGLDVELGLLVAHGLDVGFGPKVGLGLGAGATAPRPHGPRTMAPESTLI